MNDNMKENILVVTILIAIFVALMFAAQTEKKTVEPQGIVYDCAFDDEVMMSDGTCMHLDAFLDAYNDTKNG